MNKKSECQKCGRTSDIVDLNNCPFCNIKPQYKRKKWIPKFIWEILIKGFFKF